MDRHRRQRHRDGLLRYAGTGHFAGAVSLSAWVAGLDFVLLPALAIVLALTGYALWKRKQRAPQQTE